MYAGANMGHPSRGEGFEDTPRDSPQRGLRRYLDLARNRNVWGIVLGRALTDPIWWFYVFWLPQYLSDARGFSLKRIALFALWILIRPPVVRHS
jgi:MFS transporter, ACS family, hexuronate transporter